MHHLVHQISSAEQLGPQIAIPSQMISGRQRFLLLGLSAAIAVVAHFLFLLLLPQPWRRNQSTDFTQYYEPLAQNLIAGKGFYFHSKPALTYPPGIPLLYGAAFWAARRMDISEATSLRIVEVALLAFSSSLVCFLCMGFFHWKAALLASGLWSTYPFHLWLTKQPDPSSLVSVLLLAGSLLFCAWSSEPQRGVRYGTLLGLILGITALIKPIAIGLPLLFVALASHGPRIRRQSRILFSGCLLITYAATIFPWEIWAWNAGGHWIPLCTNGPNALIDGITFGTVRGLSPVALPKGAMALVGDAVTHYPQLKSTSSIGHFMLKKARETPIPVLELLLVKAVRSWIGNESHTLERWIATIQLLYLPFLLLGVRSVWKYGNRGQKNFALLAIGITAYFWIMTTVAAEAILRYMIPAICFLLVFVAVSFEFITISVFQKFESTYRQISEGQMSGGTENELDSQPLYLRQK